MHEYSVVTALLEKVTREAVARGAKAVTRVEVRIGESSGIVPGAFESAFDVLSRETPLCATAVLRIERVPARWECVACNRHIDPDAALTCGECGAAGRLVKGDELILDRVELEI